jgi:hypothetical protein
MDLGKRNRPQEYATVAVILAIIAIGCSLCIGTVFGLMWLKDDAHRDAYNRHVDEAEQDLQAEVDLQSERDAPAP